MKKIILLISILSSISFLVKAQNDIMLETPDLSRGSNVMKAFADRKSNTAITEAEIGSGDLSDLLWAANGVNRPQTGKRTAPSAQNAQDIDIYVALLSGIYLYDAERHMLRFISVRDVRILGGLRDGETLAPCVLFLVADTSRYNPRNDREHVLDMSKVDAGIVSQNISLFCSGCGLATKPRAGMKWDELREALELKESQLLLLNHPVGYPR